MKFRFAALFCAFVVSLQAQNPVMDAAAPAAPTLQIINHTNKSGEKVQHGATVAINVYTFLGILYS